MAKRTKAAKPIDDAPEAEAGGAEAAPAPSRPLPASLDEIIGQPTAVGVLRSAMGSGRLHHAWIFHGPEGVGKFSTAHAFAAALLDPTTAPDLSGSLAPDPGSPTQAMVRSGTHPDLHVVRKELARFHEDSQVRNAKLRQIPVDIIRDHLIEPAARSAMVRTESRASKAFIVDEAELMNPSGQNALLKTLEEPPLGTVIILVTSEEQRLLPTIRSRSQRVAFTPLGDADLRRWYDEGVKRGAALPTDKAQRDWLLASAQGSPGWVVSAAENGLYAWHETLGPMLRAIDEGDLKGAADLGTAAAKLVEERASAAAKADANASKEMANFTWMRRLFAMLAEHYRRGMRGEQAGDPAFLRSRVAALDAIAEAETQAASNVSGAMLLENLAAQLMERSPARLRPAR